MLGFADLARIDVGEAKTAFERAIALDSADPLPRLGLGLAMIRQSDLEQGRNEIEIAVALDPDNALLRSYLGKAFFEEKRDGQAGEQYAIAKRLDPLDPTPWLYDAILKQTQGRPGEALADVQRSIELNDNRAVYRSSLLLDSDRASRGTNLALIYDDLGFLQPGINQASRSLSFDPANAGAHRFLSDMDARRQLRPLREPGAKVDKVNPKFGVEWNVTDDLVLRGAVFRNVKPALVNNQTLEPTQIAGFNQLFDDTNAPPPGLCGRRRPPLVEQPLHRDRGDLAGNVRPIFTNPN